MKSKCLIPFGFLWIAWLIPGVRTKPTKTRTVTSPDYLTVGVAHIRINLPSWFMNTYSQRQVVGKVCESAEHHECVLPSHSDELPPTTQARV